MAFSTGLSDRTDEMRFRTTQQSPRDEPTFPSMTSPLRGIGSQMQSHTPSSSDARGSLHRRFTTNTVPTLPTLSPLSPIGQQRRQAAENSDYSTATYHKVQLSQPLTAQQLEKKKLEYEYLREQRRRFEAEMELLDLQAKNQEDEMVRLATDLNRYNLSGHQSEPTTPPEYRENGYPNNAYPRTNRFSSASLASPPGLSSNRQSRSGSQITSPPQATSQSVSHIPSKSVPGSRRNSDEEEDSYEFEDLKAANQRSAAALNRNSMPVTGYDLNGRFSNDLPDLASVLGHINTTGFLFGDEDEKTTKLPNSTNAADGKTYLHMNTTDDMDRFPILVRRDGDGSMQFSASSAALDLATTQSPGPDQSPNGWPSFARHRQAQHSLPLNTLRQAEEVDTSQREENIFETPPRPMMNHRRSMEVKFSPFAESKRSSLLISPPSGVSSGMPKLQSSFSTNDIPTIKNSNGINGVGVNPAAINSHAEQHLHKHNASLGRIPPGAISTTQASEPASAFQPLQSVLHASAPSFGPNLTSTSTTATAITAETPTNVMSQFTNPSFYNGYNLSMANQTLAMAQQTGWNGAMQMYGGGPYNQYSQVFHNYGAGRYTDSQSRVIQQRRQANSHEAHTRFQDFDLVAMRKDILGLCKDQYGCRFLQKKIEERNSEHIQIIFEETKDAVVDLMTDPFGNYLCQKLLEYANDDQRTVLIKNAAPQMVAIALNQHGTRALQKMIEFIHTPEQIATIISALSFQVVPLIQDLNGNHVIQKCLNHLQPQDAQFIFTAVGNNCIAVGTHRHGCCVLQRCIDHASGDQKAELVRQITENSIELVQDPFGNYVVQYILDLHQPNFTQPLCLKFIGKVVLLSKQKFSSNVVEKCIRVADPDTKRLLIQELLVPGELEKVLRDSFANYVIQTSLDYADDDVCTLLIDSIRPVLPAIRQTPYGRRIQSKIQEREGRLGTAMPAIGTGKDSNGLVSSPVTSPFRSQALPMGSNVTSPSNTYATMPNGYASTIASPQPHRLSNAQLPAHLQNSVQQSYSAFGRPLPQPDGSNGYNNFF